MAGKAIIIIVLGLILLIIGIIIVDSANDTNENNVIIEENQLIDAWIIKNNLNRYGDPKDTVYAGGTPLFNEKTGETTDVYTYILQRHPDRPWKK